MKLAFIGIGNVGFAIANHLQIKGFEIIVAHDNPASDSVVFALTRNPSYRVLAVQEAVDEADMVFLATPFDQAEAALKGVLFSGITLVDCTNPVGVGLTHALKSVCSGAELIQKWAADAHVVKSFTIYGFENLIDSVYLRYNVLPVMMIAGNNAQAKSEVLKINEQMGFETFDTGDLTQALHLEHMALLWMKTVRMNGHNPHMVWAKLEK